MEETRQAQVYGVRPARTFEQAAAKFVLENQHKRSLSTTSAGSRADAVDRARAARQGPLGHSAAVGRDRQREGKAVGTINHGLQIVRRILNLAAGDGWTSMG